MTGPPTTHPPQDDLARYRALLEAIRALATGPSLEETAPALLQALGVGLDWTLASLLIVDQDAGRLRTLDLWSPDPEHAAFVEATRQIWFVTGEGVPGRSWLEDRLIWVEDVRETPEFLRRAVARDTGLVTGVFVPLRAQGTVVGILELYSAQRRPVDEALVVHLEDFGAILGMALRRLRDTALLREREERIRAAIDGALDAVISIDAAGLVTEWNPQAESLFGWSADEARGRHLGDLIVPERLRDGHRAGMARLIATGQPRIIGQRLEMPAIHRTGREFPVELTVSAHHTGGQPSFSAFLRDLTDRKAAEERIAILARLPEEHPHPVLRVGADGALLYANKPGRTLLRQVPGARVGRWLSNAVRDALERSTHVELDHRSRGSTFAILVVPIPERGYANVYALDVTRRIQTEAALRDREAALRDLYLVTSEPGRTSGEKIGSLLGLVRRRFGTGTAVLGRITSTGLVAQEADAWDDRVQGGVEFPLDQTFGRRVIESGEVVTILDAGSDTELRDELAHTRHGLRSYIGAPVQVAGSLYGVLSFSSPLPRRDPFETADLEYLQLMALWVGAEIERESAREAVATANIELADAAEQARVLAGEAEAANRAKGDFLATMSHEIRTPLSGILGMVELLQGTPLAAEEQHYLEVMRSSGESLLSIINEILDFSKIESGQLDIRPVPFSPEELVVEVAALHRPTARTKGLSIRTIVGSGVPERVVGDAGRISQALGNLVSNAIKFTDTGTVTIRLSSPRERWLELSVADTGIGIPVHDRHRLFEPFVQLDSSQARRFGGSGLGLAITQQLVHRMGGTIDVTSAPGSGSTFTVLLPVVPVAADVALGPGDAQPAAPVAARRRRRRVLVVDDNPVNLELASTLLTRMGHQPVAAVDGEEALRHMERSRVDLVLLDCQLPGLDGFEVTRRVRELEATSRRRRMPIVAMTANAYNEDRHRAFAAGMDDYLTKPYRAKDLEAMVDRWLGGHDAPRRGRANRPATVEQVPATDATGRVASSRPLPSGKPGEHAASADPGVLGELGAIAGRDVVREMVALFVSTSHEAEARLRAAAGADDRAALAREAHSLRGSAGTVGADELAGACSQLEHAAMGGRVRLDEDVDAVLSTLGTTRAELERWLVEATSRLGADQPSPPVEAGP